MPLKEQDSDIKDIIPPLELADPNITIFIFSAIAVSFIILTINPLLTWLKIRKKRAPDKSKDLRKEAINKLHNLKMKVNTLSIKEVAFEVINSIRPYLQEKFGSISSTLTTNEFFTHFGDKAKEVLGSKEYASLLSILSQCDRLRFSSSHFSNSERETLINESLELARNLPKINANSSTD